MHKSAFNGLVQTAGISTPYMAPKSRGVPINDTPSVPKINYMNTLSIEQIDKYQRNDYFLVP
jgi:hypothetical protein